MYQKYDSDIDSNFWRFYLDTRIFWGNHSRMDVFRDVVFAGGSLIGVLSDKNVRNLQTTGIMIDAISDRVVSHSDIGFESSLHDILKSVERFQIDGVDSIVAIGGGSVLDAAKIVAALAANDMGYEDLLHTEMTVRKPMHLTAVPTTFGTGSEVNMISHFYNLEARKKTALKKYWLTPETAFLNPDFFLESPQALLLESAVDAFIHVFENLTLKRERNPLSDILLRHAVQLGFDWLTPLREGNVEDSAEHIMEMSLIGGIAINNGRTGLIHSLAVPYANTFQIKHSLSIIPFVIPSIRYNWPEISSLFPEHNQETFISDIQKNILTGRSEVGAIRVTEDDIKKMAKDVARDTVLFKENPVELTGDSIEMIYTEALRQ